MHSKSLHFSFHFISTVTLNWELATLCPSVSVVCSMCFEVTSFAWLCLCAASDKQAECVCWVLCMLMMVTRWTLTMQSQQSPPRWGMRRAAVLQPADRRMLQAVRDNLSHVRRAAAASTPRHDLDAVHNNTSYSAAEGTAVTSSQTTVNCSRLHYNKKAMDEIRQSLQSYHVTTHYESNTNGGGGAVAAAGSDNMVRQVVLLGANEASALLIMFMINVKNEVYKNGYRRRSCTSKTAKSHRFVRFVMYCFITTVLVAFYWARSHDTVHYECDEMVNF